MTTYVTQFRAMGCGASVWLETDADGAEILQDVPAAVEKIERQLSRFRPESELCRLNEHSGKWVRVSDTLLRAVHAAKHAARLTGGLYNPRVLQALVNAGYDRSFEQLSVVHASGKGNAHVGSWNEIDVDLSSSCIRLRGNSPIDLGGVGKGWAAAQIAKDLAQWGACLVDLGGDMVAHGQLPHLDGWDVAVAEPGHNPKSLPLLTVLLHNRAMVTSGVDHRRWREGNGWQHHVIDPRTGEPARTDVQSVTVIHPSAVVAEAYAKAVIVLGTEDGLRWLNSQWPIACLTVRDDGAVLMSHEFSRYIYTES